MKDIIIAVIGSGALTAFVTAFIYTQKGIQAGVRILLYDKIKHLGFRYIEEGVISEESFEDIVHMHDIYHSQLKGNGYLDGLMERVKALPKT